MSNPIFWRLVWKEYRLQRAFWIAMAVLAVVFFAVVLVFMREGDSAIRTMWLFDLAFALSALYALGCGATLFATEHEAGTYDFQRALPVSWRRLFFGKMTFAAASTLAMIGLLSGLAAILSGGRFLETETHRELWALWGFVAVEALVWGTFFSLLLPRPLMAAVLAAAAAFVSVSSIVFIVLGSAPQYHRGPYVAALPYRAVFLAIVGLVTIWLGHRWFRERLIPIPRVGLFRTGGQVTDEVARTLLRGVPTGGAVLGRLLWQHFRQSAGMLAVLTAMVVPLVLTGIGLSIHATMVGQVPSVHSWSDSWFILPCILGLVLAPLAGACAFLADQQRHSFRFLTERGVRPGYVWLSRHLIWLVPALAETILVLAVFLLPMGWEVVSAVALARYAGWVIGFVILAYAAGQLCSMCFSSGILAGVFSVALTVLLYLWAGLMMLLDVPWLWSVAPIPLVLFLATWLRTPHWLLERNTLRAWLPTTLSLAVPAVVILASVCAYRVYSVPAVDPGFDPAEFDKPATSEARATADMYRRGLDLYVTRRGPAEDGSVRSPSSEPGAPWTSVGTTWLEENEATLALMLEATERSDCDFHDPTGRAFSGRPTVSLDALGHLLVSSAQRLESRGDLDAAFQRYLATLRFSVHLRRRTRSPEIADKVEREVYDCLPSWAVHAGQTAERLRTAIEQVEGLQRNLPSSSDAIKSDYLLIEQILAGKLDAAELDEFHPPLRVFDVIAWHRLPWERARTRRVLNLFTARSLETLQGVESAVLRNERWTLPDNPSHDPEWHTLKRTTPLLNALHYARRCYLLDQPQGDYYFDRPGGYFLACDFARMETRRRAVRLQLALAGWTKEHGRLPKRLEELVGPFLKELPSDPYTAGPFEYFPNGTSAPVINLVPLPGDVMGDTLVQAGKPYFQSAGLKRRLKCGSDRDFVFPIPPGR